LRVAWPLSDEQIDEAPWGLVESELGSDGGKVVTDPVHGDILLMPIEVAVIDSPAFQRLRRVRQLGTTHLVYPGATHSRFSHGLGTLKAAQRLLDALMSQRHGLHSTPDLFGQWANDPDDEKRLARESARVIVLARLGALLHDLLHVPFGHSIEDDLKLLTRHDGNRERFERLWADLGEDVCGVLARKRLDRRLKPLILSEAGRAAEAKLPRWFEYPFVADLVGNTICADLLDYLDRDHRNTGLPFSLGKRFTAGFYVVPEGRPPFEKRMAVRIDRDEHERTDVVSELLKALRYRYELSERVLVHHAKLAADVMVGKTFEYRYDELWLEESDRWCAEAGKTFVGEDGEDAAAARRRFKKLFRAKAHSDVTTEARDRLDELLTSRGDDGLMEHVEAQGKAEAQKKSSEARSGIIVAGKLAGQLLRRRLFKVAGRASRSGAAAESLFGRYQDPDLRRQLERGAEEYAELGPSPKVAIWLPDPKMRLKLAEVLVDYRGAIDTFVEYERHGAGRGSEIYDAHSRLWAVWVFVDPEVQKEDRRIALSYLARELGVRWERHDTLLGPDPAIAPDHLAAVLATDAESSSEDVERLIEAARAGRARSDTATFKELLTRYKQAAKRRSQTED
jgi:HD superfamily phosphohydrolase